jgi:putative aldouronate transport system permease protein
MVENRGWGRKLFAVCNGLGLTCFTLLCLAPLLHVAALSLSNSIAASAGEVALFPVSFSFKSYMYVIASEHFWHSFGVSAGRVMMGLPLELLVTIMTAYPLAIPGRGFRAKPFYVWLLIGAMLFRGGMIAGFMVVKAAGLLNSMAALIIPQSVNVFNIILLANFFRNLPREMLEAAWIDGAGHWKTLWHIQAPVALPAIATISLFILLRHWNSWFDGMIYMSDVSRYPLQTYLQSLVIQRDTNIMLTKEEAELMALISERTIKAAQILIAALPILAVYPFLQRYFISGMVIGSVKG